MRSSSASGALSLGEGGLDEKASHSVGVHVGSWPPVLQVAIVLELHSSSVHESGAPQENGSRESWAAPGATQVPAMSLIVVLQCGCIPHGVMQVCSAPFINHSAGRPTIPLFTASTRCVKVSNFMSADFAPKEKGELLSEAQHVGNAYLNRQGNPDGSTTVSHSRSEGVHVTGLQPSNTSSESRTYGVLPRVAP